MIVSSAIQTGAQSAFKAVRSDVTRVILHPVFREASIDRVIFELAGRSVVVFHPVVRQRQNGLIPARVQVAVLDPAVAYPDVVAFPTGARRTQSSKGESQIVAGV